MSNRLARTPLSPRLVTIAVIAIAALGCAAHHAPPAHLEEVPIGLSKSGGSGDRFEPTTSAPSGSLMHPPDELREQTKDFQDKVESGEYAPTGPSEAHPATTEAPDPYNPKR